MINAGATPAAYAVAAVALTDAGGCAVVVSKDVGRATFSLSLFDLTRVIELSSVRSGTTGTGAYHGQGDTDDGFAPGP